VSSARSGPGPAAPLFASACGGFISLALLKFGNPVILEHKLDPPQSFWELLLWSWPTAWGYPLLAVLFLWALWLTFVCGRAEGGRSEGRQGLGLPVGSPPRQRGQGSPVWSWSHRLLPWVPLAWFLCQCLSALQTVSWATTRPALFHFAAVTTCFYVGFFGLAGIKRSPLFWLSMLPGLVGVIAAGFDQHFVGLEATRKYIQSQPDWQNLPPQFLQKVASDRIYSTLFYPNALAGVVLLLLPVLGAFALTITVRPRVRWLLASALTAGSLACLYWSGSKAGWLIALIVILTAWLHLDLGKKLKWIVVILALTFGLLGFFARHAGYFGRGATSASARLDYWKAAVQIAKEHPVLGSGPGTFGLIYRYLKSTQSEMANLVHNDFLEQASDSGLISFVLFSYLIIASLVMTYPSSFLHMDWIRFGTWLGLLGWALQSLVEFGLFIPAIAWPAFLFLGWMQRGTPNPFDKNRDRP
jgi:hypothetical protein